MWCDHFWRMRWYNILVKYFKHLNKFILSNFVSSIQINTELYQFLYRFIQNKFNTFIQTLTYYAMPLQVGCIVLSFLWSSRHMHYLQTKQKLQCHQRRKSPRPRAACEHHHHEWNPWLPCLCDLWPCKQRTLSMCCAALCVARIHIPCCCDNRNWGSCSSKMYK
jgi:hypothetical protein